MMKKRVWKITENAFNEIISLKRKYDMSAADIAEIVIAKGLAETISPKTVAMLCRYGTWENYQAYLAEKNQGNKLRRHPEQEASQTEIDLPIQAEEKPRMSEAARIMILNQDLIRNEIREAAREEFSKFDIIREELEKANKQLPRMEVQNTITKEVSLKLDAIRDQLAAIVGVLSNIAAAVENGREWDIGPMDPEMEISPEE